MQGMHGSQQLFADRQFAAGALDRSSNGLQVLRDLAAQDLQQHRIDRRHRRHGDDHCRLGGSLSGTGAVGIGHARFRHGLHGLIQTRYAPAYHATHRFGGGRGVILHARRLARSHLLGGLHDGAEWRRRRTVALERRQQLRQRVDGVMHHGLHALVRLDRVVQYPVEHVLHFPRELTEYAGANQPAGTLERVERAADTDQRRKLGRIGEPDVFGTAQVVDFLLHFLQEDLADIVVDTFRIRIEMSVGRQRIADRHLFEDLLLDLDPVAILLIRRATLQRRWRGGFGLRQPQSIQIVDRGVMRRGLANEQMAQIVAGKQADRLGKFRMFLVHEGVLGICLHGVDHRRRRGRLTHRRQRPVTELAKAVLGHVEDMLEAAAMLTRRLKVILQRREGIGQMIHLRPAGHAPVLQQFVANEAAHALGQFSRARGRQHAHGTGHFVHQGRRAAQAVVLPAGLDEGNDRVLHLAGIADRFLHQGRDDAQRFTAWQPVCGGADGRFVLGAQALDVVIQRRLDIQQGTGHVEQGVFIGEAQAVRDLVEYPPLFADHAARHSECQHAQRVADPLEHFTLYRQLRRVSVLLAQEQIKCFLDPQQIVLQCARHRIEQRTVVPGHRAAGMFKLTGTGQQAVQRIGRAQQLHLRTVLLGLGHDVQQLAGHLVRLATAQAVFTLFDQQTDVAVDLADQLAYFGGLTLEHALLQPFQHAGGNPPQAPAMHVIAARGDCQQGLAHADQLLRGILPAEPAQQLLLEAQAQVHQFAAMRFGIRLAHRRRRLLRQERVQIGAEHRRLGQRLLFAAGAQVIEQRQQHHRHIAMAAGQALEVVGQLHQATHQRGIGFLAVDDMLLEQRDGERFHLRGHHRRAIQLDHLQGAMHLMQMIRARAHEIALARIVDVGLQGLAGVRQGIVELRLDPLECGEIDVVLKSHAPLSTVAQRRHHATNETAPRHKA